MRRKMVAALGLVLALGAIGCGGGSDSGGSSGGSRNDFASRANAICSQARQTTGATLKTLGAEFKAHKISQAEALSRYGKQVTASGRLQARQLDALTPPAKLTTAYKGYLAELNKSVSFPSLPEVAATRAKDTNKGARQTAELNRARLAKQLRLTACQ